MFFGGFPTVYVIECDYLRTIISARELSLTVVCKPASFIGDLRRKPKTVTWSPPFRLGFTR